MRFSVGHYASMAGGRWRFRRLAAVAAILVAVSIAFVAVRVRQSNAREARQRRFEEVRALSIERDLAFIPSGCCGLDYVNEGIDVACQRRTPAQWAAFLRFTVGLSREWDVEEQAAVEVTLIDVACRDHRAALEEAADMLGIVLPAVPTDG